MQVKLFKRTLAGISALCFAAASFAAGSFGSSDILRVNAEESQIAGDFNCDGVVDMNDVIAITKYSKDPMSVEYTEQGLKNADVFEVGYGVNYFDAQAILEYLSGQKTLPAGAVNESPQEVVYGDADCDGDVDFDDVNAIYQYAKDSGTYPLTSEGLCNADVFERGYGVNAYDAQALAENLAGFNTFPVGTINLSAQEVIYGDADCDGDVDFDDVNAVRNYLKDPETYALTPDGLSHADVCERGLGVNYDDLQAIIENLAGMNDFLTSTVNRGINDVIYGDADCDGDVDFDDVKALKNYLKDPETYALTPDGLSHADVCERGLGVNYDDLQAIIENLAGMNEFLTSSVNGGTNDIIYGDADCDGDVDFDDVDAINKYLKDPETYTLTPDGLSHADVFERGYGVNYADALVVIEFLSGQKTMPAGAKAAVSFDPAAEDTTVAGDFNCDGEANISDAELINLYLQGATEYQPSEQALKNANVFASEAPELDINDVAAIAEFAGGKNTLPADKLVTVDAEHLAGDFNCDNAVDGKDLGMLFRYLNGSDYVPSAQGLANANIYMKDSTELNDDDLQALAEYFAGKNDIITDKLTTTDSEHHAGDFNCDNVVDGRDLGMLFRYVNGISDYVPSAQGLANANIYMKNQDELNNDDVQALAEYFAGKNDIITDKLITTDSEHHAGDFNCDNVVDGRDLGMLFRYVYGLSDYVPSEQGLKNANVYKNEKPEINDGDVRVLAEYLAGKNSVPARAFAESGYVSVPGDFNCDNIFDIRDAVMLHKYLEGISEYVPSEQGKKNADVSGYEHELTYADLEHMTRMLAPKAKEEVDLSKCNGDVNEDGSVNADDLVYVRKVLLGSAEYKDTCDVNSDGSFSTLDFAILKALVLQPAV